MQTPLQLTFVHVRHFESISARIRDEAANLEQFYDRITVRGKRLSASLSGGGGRGTFSSSR